MSVGNILARALVPVAVATVFALSRRYLPVSASIPVTERESHHFSKLQWVVALATIGNIIVFGFGFFSLLLWANHALASREANAVFVILPTRWIWFFLPFFGATCISWELTLRMWMVVGDSVRARKYESWSNARAGLDATRALRILTIAIAVPSAAATILALPIHTAISETTVSVGHFGSLQPTEHPFTDVRGITVTDGLRLRDGSFESRPSITLKFSDGTRWSSADNRDPSPQTDTILLNFLERKTGLAAEHIVAFPFGSASHPQTLR